VILYLFVAFSYLSRGLGRDTHNMRYVAKCVRPVTDIHTLTATFLTDKRVSYDVTPPETRDWLQVKEERFLFVV